MAKKAKASEKAVKRARLTENFGRLNDETKFFYIKSIRRRSIVFFFGGYDITFEIFEGRLCRLGSDLHYLASSDYAFLFKLAEMLFKARERGDAEAQKEKAKKPKKSERSENDLFDGQLPIRRNPNKRSK